MDELVTILAGAVYVQPGPSSAAGSGTPEPLPTRPPLEWADYVAHGERPVHMPDLLGQTLEYATSIWDDDEPLPRFVVIYRSRAPDAMVVAQDPPPGTLIVPEDTTITFTRATFTPMASAASWLSRTARHARPNHE